MLQEADMGMTNMAMGGSNARFQGDDRLLVKFFTSPTMNQIKSKEEGRPIYEDVPIVQIMQPGNKDSVIIRPATAMDKNRFAEHWRRFQAREDQEAVEGTPLTEWPGVSRALVEELRYFNILTVEQLSALSDSNAQNIMGIQMLKTKAAEYLEASATNATAEALLDANARIDALMERIEELAAERDTAKAETTE